MVNKRCIITLQNICFGSMSQDIIYLSCMFSDWYPELSGCYRPAYTYRPESKGTENNLVRALEPVVLMASNTSYDQTQPGYDAGILSYCQTNYQMLPKETNKKWLENVTEWQTSYMHSFISDQYIDYIIICEHWLWWQSGLDRFKVWTLSPARWVTQSL